MDQDRPIEVRPFGFYAYERVRLNQKIAYEDGQGRVWTVAIDLPADASIAESNMANAELMTLLEQIHLALKDGVTMAAYRPGRTPPEV